MSNLFRANLRRMWKNQVFWGCLVLTLAFSAFSSFQNCEQGVALLKFGYEVYLENYYFNMIPMIGLFSAVFISLFLGTEYSDGTIRNKLVIGHTRVEVYLSNLLCCSLACVLFTAVFYLGGLVGVPMLGFWNCGFPTALLLMTVGFCLNIALAALFTLTSMLCSRKATGVVVGMLLFLALLLATSIIYNALCQPEMTYEMMITVNGVEAGEPYPNPHYVSEPLRTVYQWLLNIFPTGQAILLSNSETAYPVLQILFSGLVTAGVSLTGIFAFRKKDLK